MQILRNVFKRKWRVILTISGITIGVLALVAMGAMAERINMMVSGGLRYYADKVTVVTEGGNLFSVQPLDYAKFDEVKAVPGVAEVQAEIATLLDPDAAMSFNLSLIGGSDMRGLEFESFTITFSQGRDLRPDETGAVVVGSDLVKKLSAKVGEYVTIRGEQFLVVGIMDKTLTLPDSSVYMSLSDAQRLFMQDIPEMYRSLIPDPSQLVTSFVVYPTEGSDPEALATAINEAVDGVEALGPSFFQDQIASMTKILNYIIYCVAAIALLVGGLSVINTMTMSVSERTREIGVRKAIGASDGQIVRQFLAEAGVIGLIGGVSGLFLGWVATLIANRLLEASNMNLFLVTPRLAAGSVIFAILLGLVSGLYPSLHAARMKPVNALRYE
jgi:putative ABC transport system permease protein